METYIESSEALVTFSEACCKAASAIDAAGKKEKHRKSSRQNKNTVAEQGLHLCEVLRFL